VIIYCIINAVSVKNSLFNENVLKRKGQKGGKPKEGHAGLKRVK
jgi:hypothetical protein